jgi:hypothetical protein
VDPLSWLCNLYQGELSRGEAMQTNTGRRPAGRQAGTEGHPDQSRTELILFPHVISLPKCFIFGFFVSTTLTFLFGTKKCSEDSLEIP